MLTELYRYCAKLHYLENQEVPDSETAVNEEFLALEKELKPKIMEMLRLLCSVQRLTLRIDGENGESRLYYLTSPFDDGDILLELGEICMHKPNTPLTLPPIP